METDDRIFRLEQAVIYLQELVLHADFLPEGHTEKATIEALGELTAAISAEHRSAT